MNAFQRKIALRVLGVHVAAVFLVTVVPFMRGCFKPKPKEIVTFIEFGAPAPQVEVAPVARMAEPEPAPEPKPAPVPEPVKPKPKPKPIPKPKPKPKVEKPKPKPKEPEKPKWKPVDPKNIKIGRKTSEKPSKPTISEKDIQKALSGISKPSTSTGNPSQINAYIGRIGNFFYTYWKPPASATSATGSTIVKISMLKNGQIVKRVKIKGSGDSTYDKTVMDAVNAVSTIPRPPAEYPYDYVEVEFRLENK